MVAMANLEIPSQFMRRFISSAIDIIIHVSRLSDGSRKVVSFQEITGMEGEVITMQELFSFRQEGLDAEGKVGGEFQFHGVRPRFLEKFAALGIPAEFQVVQGAGSVEDDWDGEGS